MNLRRVLLVIAVPLALGACAPQDGGESAVRSVAQGDRIAAVVHKDPG